MNYVVLSSIVSIINKCDAIVSIRDNPYIIFRRSYSSTIEQAAYYTVVMNKPLDIHFQDMAITQGWCFDYYFNEEYLDKGELPLLEVLNSTIQLKKVTSDMSVLWKCNVTENIYEIYRDGIRRKYHVFYLNLHVKGAKSVKMTFNEKNITFSEADLSVPYDGHSVYLYEDGEQVQVVCWNPQGTGTVYLESFTKPNGVSIANKSVRIDIELHSGSDHSYINCVYNNAEPVDRYVYRVTFVTKKPSFHSNESTSTPPTAVKESANQDTDIKSSLLLLGSSIGAVLVLLAVAVAAICIIKTRKLIKTPYVDLSNKNDVPTSQHTKERKNQYDSCYCNDHLSNRDISFKPPEGVENIDPKEHHYTEIDYLSCKPKNGETQIRNSLVYDEPYVHNYK